MRFTDIVVRNLAVPEKGAKVYVADDPVGFGVRVTAKGVKAFVLTYGKERERITIGRYPLIGLADARAEAKRILAERTLGKLRPSRLKAADALIRYFAEKETKNRASTLYASKVALNAHFAKLLQRNLEDITANDITTITDRLLEKGQPGAALNSYKQLRAFLRWCVKRRYIPHSPIEGMDAPAKTTSRERVLSDGELRAVWMAADATKGKFGIIVKLLILTGQRRSEIAALRQEWCSLPLSQKGEASETPPTFSLGVGGENTDCEVSEIASLKAEWCSFPSSKDGVRTTAPAPLAVGGEGTDREVSEGDSSEGRASIKVPAGRQAALSAARSIPRADDGLSEPGSRPAVAERPLHRTGRDDCHAHGRAALLRARPYEPRASGRMVPLWLQRAPQQRLREDHHRRLWPHENPHGAVVQDLRPLHQLAAEAGPMKEIHHPEMAAWEPTKDEFLLPRWLWLFIVLGMVGMLSALTILAVASFM